jgi:hypothetical protein
MIHSYSNKEKTEIQESAPEKKSRNQKHTVYLFIAQRIHLLLYNNTTHASQNICVVSRYVPPFGPLPSLPNTRERCFAIAIHNTQEMMCFAIAIAIHIMTLHTKRMRRRRS